MKRYKKLKTQFPKLNGGAIEVENKMTEDPQGEWVKWEDVKDMIEGQILEVKELECNCEEMFEAVKYRWADGSDASWFCPAHGYKRR